MVGPARLPPLDRDPPSTYMPHILPRRRLRVILLNPARSGCGPGPFVPASAQGRGGRKTRQCAGLPPELLVQPGERCYSMLADRLPGEEAGASGHADDPLHLVGQAE